MNKCKNIFWLIIVSFLLTSCKKDTIILPEPEPQPEPKTYTKFVFVNRNGWKADTTSVNGVGVYLQAVLIDLSYYKKKENTSQINYAGYNRYYYDPSNLLKDSIVKDVFENSVGDKYAYQIELVWKQTVLNNQPSQSYTNRVYRYNTKNYFNGSDTIKSKKDTIIKFIWPLDTNSGRFIKTYQFP